MITKTFVIYDVSGEFDNPTTKEVNDEVESITLDNLTPNTTYYVKAGVVQDGERIVSETYDSFTTLAIDNTDYFYVQNEYAGQNTLHIDFYGGANSFEYSKDKAIWTERTDYTSIVLEEGEKVYLRCSRPFNYDYQRYKTIWCQESFSIGGHIATLIDYTDYENITTIPNYCFMNLIDFNNAPNLIDCSNLDFSGITTVNRDGLNATFCNTSITTTPDLSSITTIGYQSCFSLFAACPNLTQGADFSNLTSWSSSSLNYCYNNCSSIQQVTAPNINGDWHEMYARDWLLDVAVSGVVYVSPNTTNIPTNSTSGIPTGWTTQNY